MSLQARLRQSWRRRHVVSVLDKRERFVLERRYALARTTRPRSLGSIAGELGLSRQRVAVIERAALCKLGLERTTADASADRARAQRERNMSRSEGLTPEMFRLNKRQVAFLDKRASRLGLNRAEVLRRILDAEEERERRRSAA